MPSSTIEAALSDPWWERDDSLCGNHCELCEDLIWLGCYVLTVKVTVGRNSSVEKTDCCLCEACHDLASSA